MTYLLRPGIVILAVLLPVAVLFAQDIQQTFDNPTKRNRPLDTVGWKVNFGPGTTVDTSETTDGYWVANAAGAEGEGTGYFYTNPTVNRTLPHLFWGEVPGVDLAKVGAVSFSTRNSRAEESLRLAVRIDGKWMVVNEGISDAGSSDWTQHSVALTEEKWQLLDFVPDERLSLGAECVFPKNGTLEAIGLFSEQKNDAIRIDSIRIWAPGQAPIAQTVVDGDPAMDPQPVNTSPDQQYADKNRRFQGIPGIERASNGRLWVTWYGGGKNEGIDNYVVLATSADEGKTWSSAKLVIDPPGVVRAYDPCIWTDPEGRLWLFWAQSAGWWDGRAGVWAISTSDPGSENPVWTAPRRLCDGIMMNKPTATKDGSWLLCSSIWPREPKNDTPANLRKNLSELSAANVYVSKDHGVNWSLQGSARIPERVFDEHMIVERKDGSLWMLARTRSGIAESFSSDGGKTWSDGEFSKIPHVGSRFFVRRLNSGKLLLVRHDPPEPVERNKTSSRSHLKAFLSSDDGKTWSDGLMLDERLGVSYPDGVQAPDGTIYITYDYERTKSRQIWVARFTEDDVLSGTKPESVVANQAGT